MHDEIQDTIDALDDLLDKERAALLDGNLETVGRLHLRKEALIDQLNRQDVAQATDMGALHLKVSRNQALLGSALQGVRAVSRRLAAIRRVRQSLETYDASGRRQSVDLKPGGSLEKRA